MVDCSCCKLETKTGALESMEYMCVLCYVLYLLMYYYATDSCIYMFHAFFVKHFESLKVLYNFCISSLLLLLVVVMMKNISVVLGVSYKEVDLCS